MPPYSGNWISTPVVLGTARATASRKLRGRQCSSNPAITNMKLYVLRLAMVPMKSFVANSW